tara:strand:- start:1741 stop:1965 length:225 start_codon:yes stop_codon:yes gene_type:complete
MDEKIGGWSFLILGALIFTYAEKGELNFAYSIGVMILPTVLTLLIVKFTKSNFLRIALIASVTIYGLSYLGSNF